MRIYGEYFLVFVVLFFAAHCDLIVFGTSASRIGYCSARTATAAISRVWTHTTAATTTTPAIVITVLTVVVF